MVQANTSHESPVRRPRSQRSERGGLRLFVAVYPPAAALDFLSARLESLDLPPHRATPHDQIHLTLHFIGNRHEDELEGVIEAVKQSTSGLSATPLALQRLIALPERGPAKLVAAETDAPTALLELHGRLARRLPHASGKTPRKHYLPHLTLCRFRTPGPLLIPDDLFRATGETPPPKFPLNEISLVKSLLKPGGAEHKIIARFELEGPR